MFSYRPFPQRLCGFERPLVITCLMPRTVPSLFRQAAFVALLTLGALLDAKVTMPSIFSDYAVLQRSQHTPVWGMASPQESVTVTVGELEVQTSAGSDGVWSVSLNTSALSATPGDMIVTGENRVVIHDVAIGEVWLASGQSNMEWRLDMTDGGREEVARGAGPLIREFQVERVTSGKPANQVSGKWIKAEPWKMKYFSGVAYYFAKIIHEKTGAPVGIIHAAWGGTPVETWMSAQSLRREKTLSQKLDEITDTMEAYPAQKAAFARDFDQWLEATGRTDQVPQPEVFAAADIDVSDWVTVKIPGVISGNELPRLGAFWVRKEIELPERSADHDITYIVDGFTGFESIYWNGHLIGGVDHRNWPGSGGRRWYEIPGEYVNAGTNILAIRLAAPVEPAAIKGWWNRLDGPARVYAKGEWLAATEYALPDLTAEEEAALPPFYAEPMLHRYRPGYAFNGMIHPLIPYGIRGVIWYQGENNVGNAALYRHAFPLMIEGWRELWNQGDFPFLFCQLPAYHAKQAEPVESEWAELREAQAAALQLPNTRMAVLTDLGEADNLHPRNKAPVGERLANLALSSVYNLEAPNSGPVYAGMEVEDSQVRLFFEDIDGALTPLSSESDKTAADELSGFAIRGTEGQWVWAKAKIDGDTVIVWSEQIAEPKAVRYNWADNPSGNLTDATGLPVAPFRTE